MRSKRPLPKINHALFIDKLPLNQLTQTNPEIKEVPKLYQFIIGNSYEMTLEIQYPEQFSYQSLISIIKKSIIHQDNERSSLINKQNKLSNIVIKNVKGIILTQTPFDLESCLFLYKNRTVLRKPNTRIATDPLPSPPFYYMSQVQLENIKQNHKKGYKRKQQINIGNNHAIQVQQNIKKQNKTQFRITNTKINHQSPSKQLFQMAKSLQLKDSSGTTQTNCQKNERCNSSRQFLVRPASPQKKIIQKKPIKIEPRISSSSFKRPLSTKPSNLNIRILENVQEDLFSNDSVHLPCIDWSKQQRPQTKLQRLIKKT